MDREDDRRPQRRAPRPGIEAGGGAVDLEAAQAAAGGASRVIAAFADPRSERVVQRTVAGDRLRVVASSAGGG